MSEIRTVHRSQKIDKNGDYKYYDVSDGKVSGNSTSKYNMDYDRRYGQIHKGGN